MYSENRPTYNIASSATSIIPDSMEYGAGAVGLGVWDTEAEYKDIRVTENGNTTTLPDLEKATEVLSKLYDGVYGNTFTMECKARKISGSEGFLLFFGMNEDGKQGYRFNIGGWGNESTALQKLYTQGDEVVSRRVPHRIETDRWYDLRVELTPRVVKLYVDGELIISHKLQPVPQMFLASGYDEKEGEVIIKFVNSADKAQTLDFTLEGVTDVISEGRAITLKANSLDEENSMDNPTKIVPIETEFNKFGQKFSYEFPKYSFTILRVKVQK
jgi:alpha-L-arabinofuranosidase